MALQPDVVTSEGAASVGAVELSEGAEQRLAWRRRAIARKARGHLPEAERLHALVEGS